jgi:hypothetical protein
MPDPGFRCAHPGYACCCIAPAAVARRWPAKTLKDMGYTKVFNAGGFKELADAGIEVEKG